MKQANEHEVPAWASPYPKIETVWKRDPGNKSKTLLEGVWGRPEFGYLRSVDWEFTEKVDGTNIRVWLGDDGKELCGGRTNRANLPKDLLEKLGVMFPPGWLRVAMGETRHFCLYGEGYGAGIQSGGKYRDTPSFVLFDVRVGDVWLKRGSVDSIAEILGILSVPVVCEGPLGTGIDWCRKGFKSSWGDFDAEGLVGRPKVRLLNHLGDRVITKVKCRDFS